MIYFLAVLIVGYAAFCCWVSIGWLNTEVQQEEDNEDSPCEFVSVLVPVRNEAESIICVLESIAGNSASDYEILVINDHSTDATSNRVRSLQQSYPSIRLLNLPAQVSGKKAAIAHGVQHARGTIILCTDGDCEVPANWIASYRRLYKSSPEVKMAFGPVRFFDDKQYLTHLLNLELSILIRIGAATLRMGVPTMVNGANLSYRRDVFLEVGGYAGNEQVPSGDDEFLLRKIYDRYPEGIRFAKTRDVIVDTQPPDSCRQLLSQRRRWSSKYKYHNDAVSVLLPVFVLLVNIGAVGAWSALFVDSLSFYSFLFLVLKTILDCCFAYPSARFSGIRFHFWLVLLLEIIYPLYVVFFGIASNFGKYRWKDRVYKN
jgi:cellulose synthase/poly-beta-1,6-N-acetylglucosamine synthase-like glycosyltransferase